MTKRTLWKTVLILLVLANSAVSAFAHEVRPALLEIVETAPQKFNITWKQPLQGSTRLKIAPVFPDACTPSGEAIQTVGGTIIHRWQTHCALQDAEISIEGLDRTLTDVFLELRLRDQPSFSTVLRPGAATLDLSGPRTPNNLAYLRLGIEHIAFGYDHLLFVLGLFLLVKTRQLLGTITAFTVAHSLTLGLSALAGWSLPSAPVEIIIALSISLLGLEALYRKRGRETLGAQSPWLIALGFGLIHGFGFAGALSEIGLPQGSEIFALLLFNIGVEIGQITFIGALLLASTAARQFPLLHTVPTHGAACYALGIMGGFWALERVASTYFT